MGKKNRSPSGQLPADPDDVMLVNKSQLKAIVEQIFTELLEKKFTEFMQSKLNDEIQAKTQVMIDAAISDESNQQSMKNVSDKIASLEKQLIETRIALNHLEQHSRRWAIRIHGLSAPANDENAKRVCSKFFKDKLGLTIPVAEIDCAHRVGPVRNDKQSMIVKVFKRDFIDNIIQNRKKLKASPYVIHEDSTLENRRLLNRLKNHDNIDRAWLLRGTVWATTRDGKKFKVDIYDDINKKISDL